MWKWNNFFNIEDTCTSFAHAVSGRSQHGDLHGIFRFTASAITIVVFEICVEKNGNIFKKDTPHFLVQCTLIGNGFWTVYS